MRHPITKQILGLALPNIITNITVPLLGMVDMAIVGHLGTTHIGAITIGTSIFNLIYWNFGFLRMGTSGFTAQAYGANNTDEAVRIFARAISIALAIAAALLLFQWPLSRLSLLIFNGSDEVIKLALTYFFVRIWAAPATLGLYAVKGWFIGMQNSKLPMWIAISLNIVNIMCSLFFVLVLHLDIAGVAWGTVIAQYSGLALGLFFLRKKYGSLFAHYCSSNPQAGSRIQVAKTVVRDALKWNQMRRFFKINGDIFLRTVCLAAVFTFITAASGRISDEILAVDALLLQFFTLFSYIMDGFAYAGESLVGRYIGAQDGQRLRQTVRQLLLWGLALTLLFTGLYALFGEAFLHIFSDDPHIITATRPYLFWVLVIPVCGFSAFLFDGIFVGATAGKTMRDSMFVATAAFFAVYYGLKHLMGHDAVDTWNHTLWISFMVYLSLRGILQAVYLKKSVYSQVPSAT